MITLALIAAGGLASTQATVEATAKADDVPSMFHPPVQLRAGGEVIDAGKDWGHCGPALTDIDGDGDRDLVVGDFDGTFKVYANEGSDRAPKYASAKLLEAGGTVAKVPIY